MAQRALFKNLESLLASSDVLGFVKTSSVIKITDWRLFTLSLLVWIWQNIKSFPTRALDKSSELRVNFVAESLWLVDRGRGGVLRGVASGGVIRLDDCVDRLRAEPLPQGAGVLLVLTRGRGRSWEVWWH